MTTQTKSCRFIPKHTVHACMDYLAGLNSPTALGIYLCLKYGDHASACSHDINPRQYEARWPSYHTEIFRCDYLAAKLLSKWGSGEPSKQQQRKDDALVKFWGCEDRLREKSALFRTCVSGRETVEQRVLYAARRKIHEMVGKVSDHFKADNCNFGPGSSSSIPRRKAHPSNKFLAADVSSACAPFVQWFFQDIGLPRPVLNVVEHSRVEFAPKNYLIDRVIAVEPDWNMFFQKGIGYGLRRILRRVGIDLNHGAGVHNDLAREGSLTGNVATEDQSSASDLIATYVIRFLFPDDWFIVMNSLRTDRITLDQKKPRGEPREYPLLKFSSMGNGFTFELESLVFYAIATATCGVLGLAGPVKVFGDDVILPTAAVSLLRSTFAVCGFKTNASKSFDTGYFRESCGAHYFDGEDVKPLYLKKALSNDSERFKFCNQLRRSSYSMYLRDVHDTRFGSTYRLVRNTIRRCFYIPDGVGDGGLISTWDEAAPARERKGKRKNRDVKPRQGALEGYRVTCLQPVEDSPAVVEHEGMYLHKLRTHALKRRALYHDQVPSFWWTVRDLRRADVFALDGTDVAYAKEDVKYCVRTMHVQEWKDPGQIF